MIRYFMVLVISLSRLVDFFRRNKQETKPLLAKTEKKLSSTCSIIDDLITSNSGQDTNASTSINSQMDDGVEINLPEDVQASGSIKTPDDLQTMPSKELDRKFIEAHSYYLITKENYSKAVNKPVSEKTPISSEAEPRHAYINAYLQYETVVENTKAAESQHQQLLADKELYLKAIADRDRQNDFTVKADKAKDYRIDVLRAIARSYVSVNASVLVPGHHREVLETVARTV